MVITLWIVAFYPVSGVTSKCTNQRKLGVMTLLLYYNWVYDRHSRL